MANPHHDRNDVLHPSPAVERDASRLPHPGEIIGRKEPPFQATGLDALSPLLLDVRWPATKAEVIAQVGDAVIPIDQYRTRRAAEIIGLAGPESFRSSKELEDAINHVWHERGARETRGGNQWQRD